MPKSDGFYHFDFRSVFTRTKEFIDQYNFRQDKLTNKINANHRATAELIVRLYLKQLNHQSRMLQEEPEKLPGFKTHNESLAKCKGCTKRTIINHRKRLLRAGLVVQEEHRGSGGIELWIHPEILGLARPATNLTDGVTRIGDVASFFWDQAKNFHPLVHEPQELDNNNSRVDKKEGHGWPESYPPAAPSGEAPGTTQELDKNTRENAASARQEPLEISEQEPRAGRIFLLSLIRQFWDYAQKVLYPELRLSPPEEREILNLIWESVYGKLQWQAQEPAWRHYQETLLRRVDMVARWLSRSHTRWIPQPHLYFHPNNDKNGFGATWQWYVKQETLKIEIRNQLLIQQIRREWQQHDADRGRFRHKTRLQLFRIQQQRLARYRDESLIEAYRHCLQQRLHLQKLSTYAFATSTT